MLKRLRTKLTLICVAITGILLGSMAVGMLWITENQIEKQSSVTFQNNLNSIVYKIQSSRTLDNIWLSQLEAGNSLIVYIEDNGRPIFFPGSWDPATDREALIELARKQALERDSLDIRKKPASSLNVSTSVFQLTGEQQDQYQAACAVIPSSYGWQSLVLLRDTSGDAREKLFLRLSFSLLIFLALGLLFLFSYWFSGRTIAPIEKNQRKQVEFVAAASHELRSPLAVIRASLSTVETGDPESLRFLATADRECVRMSRLVDDLLFLASTDAGTWSVRQEDIELDTLLTELYDSFLPIAGKKNQRLSLTLPEELLPVLRGDRQRLCQAIFVLLDNAISYTPENGEIQISAALGWHSVEIAVADNGPGIPDGQKDKIFERFCRLDTSRSKKEHYGLGLSVAREIVELHGGSLTAEDTPGGGSTFSLRLNV